MSKQSLLLVDGDTRSLRVLEVSLRKAGFTVTPASSVQDAIDKLELHAPDLIISETAFPDGDGFELRRRVRTSPEWSDIPFVFLTASTAIENKIRGLELGVDDYLTKPIYIKEIITRINILLQKKQRTRFEERRDGRTRFAGRVTDMPVIDVIQTIEISRKSGVIQFVGERGRQAAIYFRDGKVIDAEAGALQGEDAVYRLLTWSEGEFEVMFRTVRRRDVITSSSQGLLMEGMRRLDEWSRLLEQLPPLTHRFEVDTNELVGRLGEVPDDNNRILRLLDGKRTLLEVIDASDCGDLECLQAIGRLYFEDLLVDLDHGAPQKRDTGRPMPLVELDETPTPIEEVASGPVASAAHRAEAPVGPLLGGYRPSSLRLIDEAVAAAQAIEPSLFEDDVPNFVSREDSESFADDGLDDFDDLDDQRSPARRAALVEPANGSRTPDGAPTSSRTPTDPLRQIAEGWQPATFADVREPSQPIRRPSGVFTTEARDAVEQASREAGVRAATTTEAREGWQPATFADMREPSQPMRRPSGVFTAEAREAVQIADNAGVLTARTPSETGPRTKELPGTGNPSQSSRSEEASALVSRTSSQPSSEGGLLSRTSSQPIRPGEPTASSEGGLVSRTSSQPIRSGEPTTQRASSESGVVARTSSQQLRAQPSPSATQRATSEGGLGQPAIDEDDLSIVREPSQPVRQPTESGREARTSEAESRGRLPRAASERGDAREPSQPVRQSASGLGRESSQPIRPGSGDESARTPSGAISRGSSPSSRDAASAWGAPASRGSSPKSVAATSREDGDLDEEEVSDDAVLGESQDSAALMRSAFLPSLPRRQAAEGPRTNVASSSRVTGEASRDGDDDAEPAQPPRRISSPSTGVPEPLRREDSGLRMIGSLGRDRAEASGELVPIRPPPEPTEPPREVVTILPRRITREMPIVQPPPGTDARPPAPGASSATAAAAVPALPASVAEPPPPVAPVEMPRPLPPPARMSMEGSGVRRRSGPGLGALVLLALAALFASIAVYIRIRKSPVKHDPVVVASDAGAPSAPDATRLAIPPPVIDASLSAGAVDAGRPDAARVVDAGPSDTVAHVADAGPSDAVAATVTADASAETRVQQAKLLFEKAYAAMEEGRFQQALDLVDESLKLRRAARTLLLRAQAMQRLDRIDDALTSISEANLLYLQSEGKDFAAGWQEKGKVLWAAGRYAEAKAAYEHFLELEPTGAAADEARRRLGEPR